MQILKKAAPFGAADLLKDLESSFNLARAQAAGAGVDMTGFSVNNSLNTLYVGFYRAVRSSVRVRNLYTESYTLSANITLSHELHLLKMLRLLCSLLKTLFRALFTVQH